MRRFFINAFSLLFFSVALNAADSSAGWPTFRGNSSLQGVANSSLPEKPALLWKFKTSAPVRSSPVIAEGKAFVGSSDTNVYALEFQTGKKLWAFPTGGSVEAPALFAGGKLFIGSTDGFLYALDGSSGKLLWKYQTDGKILGAPNLVESRATRVESKTPPPLNPQPSTLNAPRILIGSYDFKLHCVDAATGKSNWVYETGNYINGSPAVAAGKTVFGGCDGLLHVISVADGKQIKEIEAGAYVAASVALADNRAYFGHYENEFLCIELNSGKTLWRYKNRDFPYMSSAAVTADRVLVGGRDKLLHCLNRENGQKIWTFATQGKVDSSPVVAGDKVVVGSDDGRIYLVALKTGKELWSYEIGAPIDSSPAVAAGKIVIGSSDGYVYCFGEKK